MGLHADIGRIALGTAQFGLKYGIANRGGLVSEGEVERLLHTAQLAGIDTLDTAIAYGVSEERLGRIGVNTWKVVTKLPTIHGVRGDVASHIFGEIERSLRRLKRESLDAILLHDELDLLGDRREAIYLALRSAKERGLASKIGISVYSPSIVEAVMTQFEVDLVQAPYNVIDRRLLDTGCADRLLQLGVEVHARSVFLQGLLLMDPERRPSFFRKWQRELGAWEQWLRTSRLTPLAAALGFVLSKKAISKIVVGVDSVEQLQQILQALSAANGSYAPSDMVCVDEQLINPSNWPST